MLSEIKSDTLEKIAKAIFNLYTNQDKFIKALPEISKLNKDATIYLIAQYTMLAYDKHYKDIPSEVFKIINNYLRKEPSFFLYETKFLLRLLENKREDAKEILNVMKKEYKSRKTEIKELGELLD